jgi:hypothetical protein
MLSGFGWTFEFFQAIPPLEALDTSRGIHQLLLSGEKRVTGRAQLQANIRFGRAGFELVAAGAGYQDFMVFGMNAFFHISLENKGLLPSACPRLID